MRRLTCALLVLAAIAAVAAAGRPSLADLPPAGRPPAGGPDAVELAAEIDRLVDARLAADGVRPAGPADDAEFLRRAYLDLHGVVPSRDQADRFLADPGPDKRSRLVDALLAGPRYGEHLADLWQAALMSPLADDRPARADRLARWLADRFNAEPWDRIVADLLTATGRMEDNPAVTYLIEGRLPRGVPDLTDLVSRQFMGVRLNCAQCHDHPTVKWTRQDFWGMAAFFAPVQTPGRSKQVYSLGVVDDPKLTLATLKDAGAIDGFLPREPTVLGGRPAAASAAAATTPAAAGTGRAALAAWLTSPDNPYFARAAANRTWWRLFGRGIVHPVDDMHDGNRPSHPELLDLLARRLAGSGFDLKFLTRAIVLSRAYQRTSRPGGEAAATATSGDPSSTPAAASTASLDSPVSSAALAAADEKQAALFGRMSVKVLTAGQLYDSLEAALGPPTKAAGVDARGQSARAEFVQFFGDAGGDPDPTAYRRGIPHLLRQMNAGQFAGRNLDALVDRLAADGRPPADVAADLFLTFLARRPTADERARLAAHRGGAGSDRDAARELAWVLMMTSEFSLNH